MGSQTIYHKSRYRIYKQNFLANSSVLDWSLRANMTSCICFEPILTNIASFTINGTALTIPYNLTNKVIYSIVITPNNPSLPSSIEFISRIEVDEVTVQNVPNFGNNNGRYTYALIEGNVVVKYDNEYFKPANFTDFNTYVVNPKIATINLPTTASTVRCIEFVVISGVQYALFIATKNQALPINERGVEAILMRLSDNAFFSLTGVSNTWSYQFADLRDDSGFSASYDYINNLVYYTSLTGTKELAKINLNTGTITFFSIGSTAFNNMSYILTKPGLAFNPYFEIFASRQNIVEKEVTVASLPLNSGDVAPCFVRFNGYFLKAFPQVNNFAFYDIYGSIITSVATTSLNSRNCTSVVIGSSYVINFGGGSGLKMYGWLNLGTLTGASVTITETTTGTTFSNAVTSDYAGIGIATLVNGNYSTNRSLLGNEIILVDPSLATPHFGRYIESAGNIVNMISTQFL